MGAPPGGQSVAQGNPNIEAVVPGLRDLRAAAHLEVFGSLPGLFEVPVHDEYLAVGGLGEDGVVGHHDDGPVFPPGEVLKYSPQIGARLVSKDPVGSSAE